MSVPRSTPRTGRSSRPRAQRRARSRPPAPSPRAPPPDATGPWRPRRVGAGSGARTRSGYLRAPRPPGNRRRPAPAARRRAPGSRCRAAGAAPRVAPGLALARSRPHLIATSAQERVAMPDLRPMDFGEILDGSLMIYRRHFGLFIKLAVTALSVPLVLLVYFVLRTLTDLQQNPVRAVLYLLPIGLVYYVASLVLTTGPIRIISDSYLGREPQLRDALSLGWSKIWPLTAVGFGTGIVAMLI